MMKKTKAQIMKDIIIYAKGKEITPSLIRKYLMEELHLSKMSAYRFFRKADTEYIVFKKKYEKRDNIDYSNTEYEELTKKTFDMLHKMGKNSLHTITLQEIQMIAEEVGTTARFLSCNILGLETKAYDKLIRGEIKESKLSLGLGVKDSIVSEKVKRIKHQLIQSELGKRFTLWEIKKVAEENEIPLEIMLKKVFCLTRTQILNLTKGKNVVFSNSQEFIDYDYNEPGEYEDIKRDLEYDQLGSYECIVFQELDKKDNIYEKEEFYIILADNQEEFIKQLNKKKEYLRIKREYLTEKYDDMYMKLLNSYRELNIQSTRSSIYTPNTNKIMESYIREIKEIISRNPKYYEFYPPKLKLEDFEKIAEDFNMDKIFLAYKMFGESHYKRKKENAKNPYFEISDKRLEEASNFYMLFQDEIEKGIKRIVNNSIRKYTRLPSDISEELSQIMRINVIIKGNEMLFYGRDYQSKEEYLGGIFSYLKAVCNSQCKKYRGGNKSLNDKIKYDSESEFGDFIPSSDMVKYIDDDEIVEEVLGSAIDLSEQQIMKDMIRCLQETESRQEALKKLAKEMGILKEELETKLNEIFERLN